MNLHPTYKKIVAGSDPAQGNVVILHAATISCCKGDCTPTSGFAFHCEHQLVVTVCPSQHEIITGTDGPALTKK